MNVDEVIKTFKGKGETPKPSVLSLIITRIRKMVMLPFGVVITTLQKLLNAVINTSLRFLATKTESL